MSTFRNPTREFYSVTGNYRVRVWVSFLEWPRPGESGNEFVQRLQALYLQEYGQTDFEIEVSYHPDGAPKQALVRLKTFDDDTCANEEVVI